MSRISFASSEKTLERLNLPCTVKSKHIHITHDLVIRGVDLYQQEYLIAGLNHFKKVDIFGEFGRWKALLFECWYSNMVIGSRHNENAILATRHFNDS